MNIRGIIRIVILSAEFSVFATDGHSVNANSEPVSMAMDDLANTAIHNSKLITAAERVVAAAQAGVWIAGAWDNPEFDAVLGEDRIGGPSGTGSGGAMRAQILFPFSFPGKRPLREAIAGRDLEAAKLALEQLRRETRIQAGEFAVRMVAAQWRAELFRRHLQREQAAISVLASAPAPSQAVQVEKRTVELAVNVAMQGTLAAEGEATQAWLALDTLVHLHSAVPPSLSRSILGLPESTTDLEKLGRQAVDGSNSLRTKAVKVRQAEEQLRLARLAPWPDISVGPFYERATAGDRETVQGIALSMPLPLLSLGRGGISAARAQADITRADAESAHEDAVHQTDQLKERISSAWARCRAVPLSELEEHEQFAQFAGEQFQKGGISLQVYLSAEAGVLEAADAALDAHAEAAGAWWELNVLAANQPEVKP